MSFVLFEENGALKAGTIKADNVTSLQIELVTGRRAKVKASHIYLRFASPNADVLLPGATEAAEEIDVDFLWQCAPEGEFGFEELAKEYFGDSPGAIELGALLVKLKSAPIYFQRKGRGRFKAAAEETVKQALAGLEKRKLRDAKIEALAAEMIAGRLPDEIKSVATELMVNPDKMTLEWKAFDKAMSGKGQAPERLLFELGAFSSDYDLHLSRFRSEHFKYGTGFPGALASWQPDAELVERLEALPQSNSVAFSVDDSSTTEIDDAFSVFTLADGRARVGIHIAMPGIAVPAGSDLDTIARERMSTVYMPGDKITMLAGGLVDTFSLNAGREVPALSLYFELDATGKKLQASYSQLERIKVADNLRNDLIDDVVTESALEDDTVELPYGSELRVLWQLMLAQCAERERVRGKPEPRFRSDFSFRIEGETVHITQRRRDAPLSRIVAEMMILANSSWGKLLVDHEVAGVYRSQQGGPVRMSTQALPHEGLGVMQYIWATSPLRRYIDLVNQRQLIAALENETAPLESNSADLFSVVAAFDARRTAYQDFQQRMERYWCLRWLNQQPGPRLEAVAIRDDMVRMAHAPLYFRVSDAPLVAPGRSLTVDVINFDTIDLSLEARFVALDGPAEPESETNTESG